MFVPSRLCDYSDTRPLYDRGASIGVGGIELPTVKRRFMLALELVRLRLEPDLRRPPSRGPAGGRPVERLSSLRNDSPHDCAVKLHVSDVCQYRETYLETYCRQHWPSHSHSQQTVLSSFVPLSQD